MRLLWVGTFPPIVGQGVDENERREEDLELR